MVRTWMIFGVALLACEARCELYQPVPCDGERIPKIEEQSEIDPRLIVDQGQTGTCYACATLPSLINVSDLPQNERISPAHLVLLAGGKQAASGGQSLQVFERIRSEDFQLRLDEGHEIQNVFEFDQFVRASSPANLTPDTCFRQADNMLPSNLKNLANTLESILKSELANNPKTAGYEAFRKASKASDYQIQPFNVYVFNPKGSKTEKHDQVLNQLQVLLNHEPKVPVVFSYSHPTNYYNVALHYISIADIRTVECRKKDGTIEKNHEIKVINNWGPGTHNGWFRAEDFINAANSLDPIVYIKPCEKGGEVKQPLEKCVSYTQGQFYDHSPLSHAIVTKNYTGVDELLDSGVVLDKAKLPVQALISGGKTALVKKMITQSKAEPKDLEGALVSSVEANQVEILRYLVSIGVDVNSPTRYPNPLLVAVKMRNKELVEELLKLGADPTFKKAKFPGQKWEYSTPIEAAERIMDEEGKKENMEILLLLREKSKK